MIRAWRNINLYVGELRISVHAAPATGSTGPRGTTVCAKHLEPVARAWLCDKCGGPCQNTAIAYRHGDDLVVADTAADDAKAEPSDDLHLTRFHPLERAHPIALDRSYLLWPRHEQAAERLRLLHQALDLTGKVGAGALIISRRPRVVIVGATSVSGALVTLHTLRAADEIRAGDIDQAAELTAGPPAGDLELDLATRLIGKLTAPELVPEPDAYRAAIAATVDDTAKPTPIARTLRRSIRTAARPT